MEELQEVIRILSDEVAVKIKDGQKFKEAAREVLSSYNIRKIGYKYFFSEIGSELGRRSAGKRKFLQDKKQEMEALLELEHVVRT